MPARAPRRWVLSIGVVAHNEAYLDVASECRKHQLDRTYFKDYSVVSDQWRQRSLWHEKFMHIRTYSIPSHTVIFRGLRLVAIPSA